MTDLSTPPHKEFTTASAAIAPPSHPILKIDMAEYLAQIEDFEMTEAQKREFLETLWNIMVSFVDLGFSVESSHVTCGEVDLRALNDQIQLTDEVESNGTSTHEAFSSATEPKEPGNGDMQ